MTTIREASTMYASFFSLILFLILFESRYSRRKTLILTAAVMGPVVIANFVLLAILGPTVMGTLLLLTSSLPSLIFFWFLSKYRDGRFLFTFCFADTIMLEIIDITAILDYFLGSTYIFLVISRLLLCPAVVFLFWKWIQPTYQNLQQKVTKGWYTFSAISLLYYVIMSLAMTVPSHITQRPDQMPVMILLLLLLPFLYIHFISTLHYQEKAHEAAELENIHTIQVSRLLSRLDEFHASNEQLQQERHDFRHNMRTISALAEKGDLEAIVQTAAEYTKTLPKPVSEHFCDYKILDAVLASYLGMAKKKGIHVTTKMLFPDELPANETSLATALANALENAIQACEKVEIPKRYIEVKSITHPRFMIQIRNSYDGIIAFDKEGIPLATKKGHGFGTRSIVTFCDQNHAFYEFSAIDHEFIMRLIF